MSSCPGIEISTKQYTIIFHSLVFQVSVHYFCLIDNYSECQNISFNTFVNMRGFLKYFSTRDVAVILCFYKNFVFFKNLILQAWFPFHRSPGRSSAIEVTITGFLAVVWGWLMNWDEGSNISIDQTQVFNSFSRPLTLMCLCSPLEIDPLEVGWMKRGLGCAI